MTETKAASALEAEAQRRLFRPRPAPRKFKFDRMEIGDSNATPNKDSWMTPIRASELPKNRTTYLQLPNHVKQLLRAAKRKQEQEKKNKKDDDDDDDDDIEGDFATAAGIKDEESAFEGW